MARAPTSSRSARKRPRRSSDAAPAAAPSRSDPTSNPTSNPGRLSPTQTSSPERATSTTHAGSIKRADASLSTTSPVLTTRAFAASSSPKRSTSQGGGLGDEPSEDEEDRLKHWDNFVEEYHDGKCYSPQDGSRHAKRLLCRAALRHERRVRSNGIDFYLEIATCVMDTDDASTLVSPPLAVIELPLEFRRTFTLVRELEDSQQAATLAFKQQLLAYLHLIALSSRPTVLAQSVSKGASAATRQLVPPSEVTKRMMLHQVTKAARATIRAVEDKINLTQTLYESVDRHIQRLDNDLARHEDSFVLGMRPGTLPSHDAPSVSQKEAPGATTSRGAIALGEKEAYEGFNLTDDEERYRRGRGGADGRPMVGTDKYMQDERRRLRNEKLRMREEKQQLDTAMGHIDPNEPTYCFCERVSFGQMVGCENEDCSREWFHFECVGLDAPPVGEWYCLECAAAVGRGTSTTKKGR
ncbi:BQ2448_2366 [Microbotryum intermedium]|uniref:BQ2448_2366 protein n=1 Tax=Microbotryum intermedium TaxID=269621 RepID=A0A238FE21_9BASI|nr:BQ2448_2366 [Microbotryum intermedium]